ncbi:MAG: S8 family serine peptidase [Acidobacteria bacterium]|nr:S8 family serine peptidase [Acidobacteriota bacterium]
MTVPVRSCLAFLTAAVFMAVSFCWNISFANVESRTPSETSGHQRHIDSLIKDLNERQRSDDKISNIREVRLPHSSERILLWKERDSGGHERDLYAIALQDGSVRRIAASSNVIRLRHAQFDPLVKWPRTPDLISASANDNGYETYIVQFVSQPIQAYRDELARLGGVVSFYVHDNAYLARMDEGTAATVSALPFVRWLGQYEPAFKLEDEILSGLTAGTESEGRFNIMLTERGEKAQRRLAKRIAELGGTVHKTNPAGFRLEATLTPEVLLAMANDPDVLFIDRWAAHEMDMDIVRDSGGANYIENTFGYRGEGVRGEVMDNGLRQTHNDLRSGNLPLIHSSPNTNESTNHGTSSYGIIFGRGSANMLARGMLPEAQGIFADYDFLSDRYAHTARLVGEPYNAVFQSNSWGTSLSQYYRIVSAELDDIAFLHDILIVQSQSNTGTRMSRPEAWAKNVVSVGGIYHYGTPGFDDDRWDVSASHGPASDGRIKPDLAHFNDGIFTTSRDSDSSYTEFKGTSAAVPITAGHFGIFYQMWHNGLFDNPVSRTVFESRPHMTTAKAMMINTAEQWDMTLPGTDIRREHQGFGRVSLTNLNAMSEKMLIVDESDVLTEFETRTYFAPVVTGMTDPLKITMVYADPMGNPASQTATVNDLDLKATAPDGTVYWGNVGLGIGEGMWSLPGGEPNTVDTVENVFIENPMTGVWRIEVTATALNQDARVETPDIIDADFALVASGIARVVPTAATTSITGRVITADGHGINRATLTLTDAEGVVRRTLTNPFGYFRFDGLPVSGSYVLEVSAKRNSFDPASRFILADGDMAEIVFIAAASTPFRPQTNY